MTQEIIMIRPAFILVIGLVFPVAFAGAQSNAPPENTPQEQANRYTFNRVDDGFVRLDNVTGQVAFCSARAVGWACQAMPEERTALEKEILRLSEENAAFKKQLAARGLSQHGGNKSEPPSAKNDDQRLKLPTDQDLERVMAFVEKAWRRFVDMINNLQKDMMRKG
jgi:hypothetical protein